MQKKILETRKSSIKKKLSKRNISLILIQILKRIKITTQIERKNILTRNEDVNWYTRATWDSRDLRDVIYQKPRKNTIRRKKKVRRGKRSHKEIKEENIIHIDYKRINITNHSLSCKQIIIYQKYVLIH